MPKAKISITIDEGILDRIDRLAEKRQEGRSVVLERIVRNGIEAEEGFLDQLGQPVIGPLIELLMKSPKFMEGVARIAGDNIPREQFQKVSEAAERLRGAGKRQRTEKKGK